MSERETSSSMTTSAQISMTPDGCGAQSAGHQKIHEEATKSSIYGDIMEVGKVYAPLDTGFMPVLTNLTTVMPLSDKFGGIDKNNTRRMSGGSDTTMESAYQSSAGTSPTDNSFTPSNQSLYSPFNHSGNYIASPMSLNSSNLGTSSLLDQYFQDGTTAYKEFIPSLKPVGVFGYGGANNASPAGNLFLQGNVASATNISAYSTMTRGENYWDNHVYTVQFKRAHRYYMLPKAIPGVYTIGAFVKVEADRGEDLGIIIEKVEISSLRNGNVRTRLQNGELKSILYNATYEEIAQLNGKAEEERAIVRIATERMNLMYGGQLAIVDADYQFDRHKLTIYYESNQRIDFRDFVRDLFTVYKTRIWMEHVTYSFRPNEAAAIALQTGENMDNLAAVGMSHDIAAPQHGAAVLYPPVTGGATIGQYGVPKTSKFGTATSNNFAGVSDIPMKAIMSLSHITLKKIVPHAFANENFIQPRNLNQYNNFNLE